MKSLDWHRFINDSGDFEFPKYLFKSINDLMKTTLDLGTLVCSDPAKLRAYKETVKSTYKQRWNDIAKALEFFDIIRPCSCNDSDFCEICGGSRFLLNEALTADEMRDIGLVVGADVAIDVAAKLQEGLKKALSELRLGDM